MDPVDRIFSYVICGFGILWVVGTIGMGHWQAHQDQKKFEKQWRMRHHVGRSEDVL